MANESKLELHDSIEIERDSVRKFSSAPWKISAVDCMVSRSLNRLDFGIIKENYLFNLVFFTPLELHEISEV